MHFFVQFNQGKTGVMFMKTNLEYGLKSSTQDLRQPIAERCAMAERIYGSGGRELRDGGSQRRFSLDAMEILGGIRPPGD